MTLPNIGCWNIRGFNKPEKVLSCKNLIASNKLDIICILEAKISSQSFLDPWFVHSHQVFPNELSCNNSTPSSSGRIWVKWNCSTISFIPLQSTSQMIHGNLSFGSTSPFLITFVYAANSPQERTPLWKHLTNLADSISSPWIIMGDFNCYKDFKDKVGGAHTHFSRLGELNGWMFNSGTIDLNSVGLRYTWFNGRLDDPIHIKLDRMVVNQYWLDCFPLSYYKVVPPLCSDHSPLLLQSGQHSNLAGRFQFKNFWLQFNGFWDILFTAFSTHFVGSPIANLFGKLKELKCLLKQKTWAHDHFIKAQLEDLTLKQKTCIEHIQQNPLDPSFNALFKEINHNISYYQEAWNSWITQRAKAKWLQQGEDDLGFLYARIKTRANINRIKEITTDEGHFSSPPDIVKAIVEHFRKLFNPQQPAFNPDFHFPVGYTVPNFLMSSLVAPVTDDEIKQVVFSEPSSSSPGPDGYTFEFYKGTWDITGFYVINAVKNFFTAGHLPRCAKATAITLIPKNQHATNISDFCPISLCNVFYKIIAKILAQRLKVVMPLIIHKSQAGFISKRISTDNIILANEILHDFNSHHMMKFFCAKLDIRKAFDSVSWEFLISRLRLKGFPHKFIAWIKCCIYEVPFSVCINGVLEGFFYSSSGLRQGCPLSPLLFAVVMDALSCSLDSGSFQGIPFGLNSLSHLLYADDVLVFGIASMSNAYTLADILKHFAEASGLHTNNSKCSILFSKNTSSAPNIVNLLGFTHNDHSLKYLGLPISTKKLNLSHFQPLLSRISTLLAGWKVKFLSFAGRIQFLRFTIANTLAYWIRGAIIPKSCCKIIDRLCSKFLYHNSIEGKKLHLIAWHNTCKPHCFGGLGIPDFKSLSYGFGCSFIWRFYNTDSLAADWFRHKYSSPWKVIHSPTSRFWKFIQQVAGNILGSIQFLVTSSNCKLSMFWDPWVNGRSISDIISPLPCPPDLDGMVSNYFTGGRWNCLDSLPVWTRHLFCNFPVTSSDSDCLIWKGCSKPMFKNFRLHFFKDFEKVGWSKFIWHKRSSLRFSSYAWLLMCNGLKLADVLAKRNIIIHPTCQLCLDDEENSNHLFFLCDYSFAVLTHMLPVLHCFLFRPNLMQVFQFLEDFDEYCGKEKSFCYFVICCAIYYIWRERNNRRFASLNSSSHILCKNMGHAISLKVANWKNAELLKRSFPRCFS
ncbi:Putative ribonuclease H protein [Dendrobium catenatum]|uniref:Ribonuclease H protein n=1 Tax=Dendrobium catenatum TaxID=906689 RepID=A0A2I0X9T8_9ASPA|nr:Putative ribonuclease H protein [Dendrobium catenatum]